MQRGSSLPFLHTNDTCKPVPCVSSPVGNGSCPYSTCWCGQCVIPLVSIRLWRMGHGRMIRKLATAVGGEACLWDSGVLGSLQTYTSWSNSLITCVYPAANARRHVLIFSPYKIILIWLYPSSIFSHNRCVRCFIFQCSLIWHQYQY